jgi:D-serine deaminase-like pyridoxal phosphate-dependent protein
MRVAMLETVDTPALLLDLDRVEQNIDRMSGFFADRTADLRPHFKTPKCPEVARLQLDAGAIGITCAKIGEAEALAASGIRCPVLIANQVIGRTKLERLLALAETLPEVMVAVDQPSLVEALDSAVGGARARIGAVVEVDIGMHRCGTEVPEESVELARALQRSRVEYRGMMGYEGHAVLVPEKEKRESLAREALARLAAHRQALADAGLAPEIVSAGGTGTYDLTGSAPGVTEVQAGSYVFMDGAYRRVRTEFECALTILTTVIRVRGRMLITDCGMKALSHEFGMPEGADLPLRCAYLSEEHGHVLVDEDADLDLAPGSKIRLLPSHGDTTINLHDCYVLTRGSQIEGTWPITARGQFR